MQQTLPRPSHPTQHHWWRWVAVLLIVGMVLAYLQGAFRVRVYLRLADVPSSTDARFMPSMAGITSSIITDGRVTHFYSNIDEMFAARLALIHQARHNIRFETYYMRPGHRADQFLAALTERARQGVNVEFMIDSQGSWTIPGSYWDAMRAGGVKVRFFSPFDWKNIRLYNDRTHRKLLLVDGSIAQIGGAGISDEWDGLGKKEKTAPWADLEIRLVGPAVEILEGAFLQHWMHEDGTGDLDVQTVHDNPPTGQAALVTVGDPDHGDSNIRTLFTTTIMSARHRLWISSPYFLPDPDVRQLLINARKQGVDVRILTEGPHNDNSLAYEASRDLDAELLRGGVIIEEYQPAMMHAKSMLVDDAWVSTGSANFDPRALFHNDELNISLKDPALAKQFEGFFEQKFALSHRLTTQELAARKPLERLKGVLGYFYRWQL